MRSIKHYLGFSDEKEILEERNRMYIDYVCAQTGWDREEAVHQMEGFRAQGVSYRYYVKKRLWAREGRKQEISLRNIEKEKRETGTASANMQSLRLQKPAGPREKQRSAF